MIFLSVRILETIFPPMMELAGDGIVPGPSHWRPVSSTSTGRETKQVRVTVVPDMTGEGGEDVREMLASATQRERAFGRAILLT